MKTLIEIKDISGGHLRLVQSEECLKNEFVDAGSVWRIYEVYRFTTEELLKAIQDLWYLAAMNDEEIFETVRNSKEFTKSDS